LEAVAQRPAQAQTQQWASSGFARLRSRKVRSIYTHTLAHGSSLTQLVRLNLYPAPLNGHEEGLAPRVGVVSGWPLWTAWTAGRRVNSEGGRKWLGQQPNRRIPCARRGWLVGWRWKPLQSSHPL